MKSTKLSLLFLAGAFVPGNLVAETDLGNSPSFYDADNWYGYRSNTNVQVSSTESSVTFSRADDASYFWTYFDPVTLSVGQKLSFFGTFTFEKIASGGVFSVGLFNSGPCGKSQMITHTYQSKTDVSSMGNYSEGKNAVSTATGGMTGVSANATKGYLRTTASSTAFLSTSSGAQQKSTDFEKSFSSPVGGEPYAVALEILKTADGLDFSVAFDGADARTLSFETDLSTFDVFGIRSPVTASGSITLSGVSISIPEPSAFGLFLGIFSVSSVLIFRRARKCKNG